MKERYYRERRRNELVGLPLVSTGLGEIEVGEDAVDELVRHFGRRMGPVVQGGDGGEDGGAGIRGEAHIAEVDAIEGRFADAEQEWSALLEANIGSPMDEVGGEAVGDGRERSHGTGKDDHSIAGAAATGDAGADVGVGVLRDFSGALSKKLQGKIVATADLQLGGEDAQGVF